MVVSCKMLTLMTYLSTLVTTCYSLTDCEKDKFKDSFLLNGVCYACPEGFYGINCTLPCPTDYHGLKCEQRCLCMKDQLCHPIYGCVYLDVNGSVINNDIHEGNTTSNSTETNKIWIFDLHQWFLVSVCLMGSNVILIISVCVKCAPKKCHMCSKEDYRPKEIIDILTLLVENNGRRNNQTESVDGNTGSLNSSSFQDRYSEVGEAMFNPLPQFPVPCLPSTSFTAADEGQREPGTFQTHHYSSNSRSQTGRVLPASCQLYGYNSLRLKSRQSTLQCQVEYSRTRDEDQYMKGSARGQRKSVLQPLRQLGGRISQFIADRYNGPTATHVDGCRDMFSMDDNIYTNVADCSEHYAPDIEFDDFDAENESDNETSDIDDQCFETTN